jgi:hypothetical protein
MRERYLLFLPYFPGSCLVQLAQTGSLTVDGAFTREVKIDRPIETLDSILYKEGHLDVLVLEKLVQLLFHYLIVVCTEILSQTFELRHSILN